RRATIEGSPVGIELLFTVSEEDSLAGAKAFDATRLRSRFGYVFDHATPIGGIDPDTTANVGSVHGGVGTTNVVPDRCRLAAECRSLDLARAETVVSGI